MNSLGNFSIFSTAQKPSGRGSASEFDGHGSDDQLGMIKDLGSMNMLNMMNNEIRYHQDNLHIPLRSDPFRIFVGLHSKHRVKTLQKVAGTKITPATIRLCQGVVNQGVVNTINQTHVKPWFKLFSRWWNSIIILKDNPFNQVLIFSYQERITPVCFG